MLSTKTLFRLALVAAALMGGAQSCAQSVVVVGHAGVRKLDSGTVLRIYTGRTVEVDGSAVTAINAPTGSPVRSRFLQNCLRQDEDRYTAHWTVRKYIGKGASPREIPRSADVLTFVSSTPGAIGYVDESDIDARANVLLRCNTSIAQTPVEYFLDLLASHFNALGR